jgi:hypothetical protein
LPDQILSEQGKRNLDAGLHQTNQPRSERVLKVLINKMVSLPVSTGSLNAMDEPIALKCVLMKKRYTS